MTAVNRSLDATSEPYLHRSAYSGGLDARHRFGGQRTRCRARSTSAGWRAHRRRSRGPSGTRCTCTSGPTARWSSTPTRTSLAGNNLELRFAKVGGKRLVFETAYQRRTPGFEINDIGFLRQADQQMWTTWATLAFRDPTGSSASCAGTSTTGSTGASRACPPSARSTPTCTPSSTTAGGCTWAARSASSARPTATAAPAAARRSGRTRTSRPGSDRGRRPQAAGARRSR